MDHLITSIVHYACLYMHTYMMDLYYICIRTTVPQKPLYSFFSCLMLWHLTVCHWIVVGCFILPCDYFSPLPFHPFIFISISLCLLIFLSLASSHHLRTLPLISFLTPQKYMYHSTSPSLLIVVSLTCSRPSFIIILPWFLIPLSLHWTVSPPSSP